jgi:levanase
VFVDRSHSGVTEFSREFPARTAAPLDTRRAPLAFTILVDRSTVEVFAQGGSIAITNLVYPPAGAHAIEFLSGTSKPGPIHLDVWELRSAWDSRK